MHPSTLRPKIGRVPSSSAHKRFIGGAFQPAYVVLPVLALLVFGFTAISADNKSPISAAQAASSLSEQPRSLRMAKGSQMIVLKEGSGTIVGQMTKILPENDQVTEIRTASVEQKDRQNLLSIVGKY